MIRFSLNAFSGERTGDMAVEVHQECECTLFALICNTCSGGHNNDCKRGRGGRGHCCTRVHPDYDAVLRDGDVGVFIGATHKVCTPVWGGRRAMPGGGGSVF